MRPPHGIFNAEEAGTPLPLAQLSEPIRLASGMTTALPNLSGSPEIGYNTCRFRACSIDYLVNDNRVAWPPYSPAVATDVKWNR